MEISSDRPATSDPADTCIDAPISPAPVESLEGAGSRWCPATLSVTEPELVEIFDNFAFGEVLAGSRLDVQTRLMVQLAGRGVALPLDARSTTTPETRGSTGRAVQEHVAGAAQVRDMYSAAPADEKHIQQFLSANCFGDHLARAGVELATRELLTFSMLVALGGADAQVRGHVAGNLNVGNTRRDLIDVVTVLVPFIGYPRSLNALAAVDAVAPARPDPAPESGRQDP
jgi:alkylhydroperoxidase/carboxymuconolactone decarboxylase family protein YurZ